MKTKTGLLLALAAAILTFISPTDKKEIIKMIVSVTTITNSR
ncbi:MAG TPA: hypothetical protein PKN96_02340 [Flavobacterium sp.]|nr:hypothetical protein [Flavobacterium sp.]HNP32113.1 hypothetical protein [Flavobacterium sp.]